MMLTLLDRAPGNTQCRTLLAAYFETAQQVYDISHA